MWWFLWGSIWNLHSMEFQASARSFTKALKNYSQDSRLKTFQIGFKAFLISNWTNYLWSRQTELQTHYVMSFNISTLKAFFIARVYNLLADSLLLLHSSIRNLGYIRYIRPRLPSLRGTWSTSLYMISCFYYMWLFCLCYTRLSRWISRLHCNECLLLPICKTFVSFAIES